MNYQKIYNALVEKAKVRGLDKSQHEGYFEIHHILPKCLGGSDEDRNLVMFTAREHYVAHLILANQYPEVEGLTYAAFMMSAANKGSRHYSKLRLLVSNYNSERNTGKLKVDYTGKQFGRLTVLEYFVDHDFEGEKIPKWKCLCTCGEFCYLTTANIKRERVLSCGCLALESKRDRWLGKEKPEYVRNKISETLKSKNIKPWQNYKIDGLSKEKWLSAHKLFEFWMANEKPKSMNMTKIYNETFGTDHKRSFFKTIVGQFLNGWIPLEDEEWVQFSKGS